MKALISQLRTEFFLALRQGEQVLVSIGIPVLVLAFFSTTDVLPVGIEEPVDFVTPGVLALAVLSTSLVSLGISTGFDRHYGVLKRLGASPLGASRWILSKVALVLVIEVIQWVILVSVALALGWSPQSGWIPALLGALLGTSAFAGIGLLMAGTLPGLVNMAATNGLYLLMLLTGGMVLPIDHLPGPLAVVANALPAAPLSEVMAGSFRAGQTVSAGAWVTLTLWAVFAPIVAAAFFKWE